MNIISLEGPVRYTQQKWSQEVEMQTQESFTHALFLKISVSLYVLREAKSDTKANVYLETNFNYLVQLYI